MKKYINPIAIAVLSALALFASGCEDSENPASDPQEAEPVTQLHGVWRTEVNGGDIQFYHVGTAGGNLPESMLRVELITHKENDELETHNQLMIFIPGAVDDRPVLSGAAIDRESFAAMYNDGWDPERVGDYFLFTYRLDGGELFLRGIDHGEKRRLIEDGEIEGEIAAREGRFAWTSAKFTVPTETLAEFLASPAADSLFAEREQLFRRLDGIERP